MEPRGAGCGRAAGRWWEAWRSPGRMRGRIAAAVVGGLFLAALLGLVRLLDAHVHITIR
ncbi:hypothetical protein ACFC6L_28965 [Kitasatospora phosalacinea]|uniref:hypothetical protein n=1 Tax=Kitasatospora phosalacinea TaxID=2065 RepID=UPI0035E2242C